MGAHWQQLGQSRTRLERTVCQHDAMPPIFVTTPGVPRVPLGGGAPSRRPIGDGAEALRPPLAIGPDAHQVDDVAVGQLRRLLPPRTACTVWNRVHRARRAGVQTRSPSWLLWTSVVPVHVAIAEVAHDSVWLPAAPFPASRRAARRHPADEAGSGTASGQRPVPVAMPDGQAGLASAGPFAARCETAVHVGGPAPPPGLPRLHCRRPGTRRPANLRGSASGWRCLLLRRRIKKSILGSRSPGR